MKILFLDIDGVLNSRRSMTAFGACPWTVEDDHMPLFDLVAVGLIRKLCDETGAECVLSSTWRRDPNWRFIGQKLEIPIIARTPEQSGPRGREIEAWVGDRMKQGHVKKYAIIDDDSDMLPHQLPFFVQTCPRNGMLLEHYEKLKEILN